MRPDFDQLFEDYGYNVSTPKGTRAFERATRPARGKPKYASAGLYVAAVRRIHGFTKADHDGRLLAVGWNRWSPREFVDGGHLARWLRYWAVVATRPHTVGSCCNHDVEDVARAFFAGLPALACRGLPADVLRRVPGRLSRADVSRYVLAARCYRRTPAQNLLISLKAAVALGRFSVEEQAAALAPFAPVNGTCWRDQAGQIGSPYAPTDGRARPVRIRDVDWGAVRDLGTRLAADKSGRLRAVLAYRAHEDGDGRTVLGRRFRELVALAGQTEQTAAAWLCPAYPALDLARAVRVARGETPVQLSAGKLDRKEAHAWLLDGGPDPLAWFCARSGVPEVRSWPVARWLVGVYADPARKSALTRERTVLGPAGAHLVIRYADRVDELLDEDVVVGRSVDAVFAHAAQRAGSTWLDAQREDYRVLAPVPERLKPFRKCMRPLVTPAQLVREGDELNHCVGTYVSAVERGDSVIFSINVLAYRSTVELRPDGRVLQHRGPHNADPHPLCKKVVERFLRRSGVEAVQ